MTKHLFDIEQDPSVHPVVALFHKIKRYRNDRKNFSTKNLKRVIDGHM